MCSLESLQDSQSEEQGDLEQRHFFGPVKDEFKGETKQNIKATWKGCYKELLVMEYDRKNLHLEKFCVGQ